MVITYYTLVAVSFNGVLLTSITGNTMVSLGLLERSAMFIVLHSFYNDTEFVEWARHLSEGNYELFICCNGDQVPIFISPGNRKYRLVQLRKNSAKFSFQVVKTRADILVNYKSSNFILVSIVLVFQDNFE